MSHHVYFSWGFYVSGVLYPYSVLNIHLQAGFNIGAYAWSGIEPALGDTDRYLGCGLKLSTLGLSAACSNDAPCKMSFNLFFEYIFRFYFFDFTREIIYIIYIYIFISFYLTLVYIYCNSCNVKLHCGHTLR